MSKKYENINDGVDNYDGEKEKKKKRYTLNPFEIFYGRDGKGVKKGTELNVMNAPGLKNFFKLFRFKLNHIFSVNLLLIFGNFPLLFALFALAYTMRQVEAPHFEMYSAIEAIARFDNSPLVASLMGIFGQPSTVSVFTTSTYIFLGLACLILFTWGPVNVGTAYILRNLMRGEPVFVWQDFWYAIKRNIKQAIIFGIIDIVMIAMLVFDVSIYSMNIANLNLGMFMFIVSIAMVIVYFFARMYIYPMIVTFDLTIFKLIKNGLFFSILGIKRNIMALLGTLVIVLFDLWLLQTLLPLGLILPFFIFFGLIWYMCIYAAYPKIKEIMIDPYYNEIEVESEDDE